MFRQVSGGEPTCTLARSLVGRASPWVVYSPRELRSLRATKVHWRKAVHRKTRQGARWFLCEPLSVTTREKEKGEKSIKN